MKLASFRLLAAILCLTLTMAFVPFSAVAEELTEGDYTYALSEDGTAATIVAYNGNDIDVVIPETLGGVPVEEIGEYAFELKTEMQSVTFPSTLKAIRYSAFSSCTALKAVDIPHTVTEINSMVFYNCYELSTVNVGPYTTYIGSQAFHNTKWIESAPNGPLYIGRVLYTYIGNAPANTTVTVKYGTASISPYAFENQAQIVAVYLPVGMRTLDTCAFLNCTALLEVRIPPSVTVEEAAFLNAGVATVRGTYESSAYAYAKENGLYFEYDETLDYPDGDVNFDKLVNTTDFRIVLRHLLDKTSPCDEERLASCDIVYDGEITTLDVRTMLLKAIGAL